MFASCDLEVNLPRDQQDVEVTFKFENSGDESICIIDLQSTCPCVVISAPKRRFMPGDSGTIAIRFRSHLRVGQDSVTVLVVTDEEGVGKTYSLQARARISSFVRIDPDVLIWDPRTTHHERRVVVFPAADARILLDSVSSRHGRLAINCTSDRWSESIVLLVAPPQTDQEWEDEIVLNIHVIGIGVRQYRVPARGSLADAS